MTAIIDYVRKYTNELGIEEDTIKIAGSSVYSKCYRDIDIFTYKDDVFSRLLFISKEAGFHPILMSKGLFDQLHELHSFLNFCFALNMDGTMQISKRWIEGKTLMFNPNSAGYFSSISSVARLISKLTGRGYIINGDELDKARNILQTASGIPEYLKRR